MNSLIPEYNSEELLGGIRLFLYEKKIIYLSQVHEEAKETTAGFVKLLREKDACNLDIHIQSTLPDGAYRLFLLIKNEKLPWGNLTVKNGNAVMQKQLELHRGMICIGGEEYEEDCLQGILLYYNDQCRLTGYFRETQYTVSVNEEIREKKAVEKNGHPEDPNVAGSLDKSANALYAAGGLADIGITNHIKIEEPVSDDKWEQLQKYYQNIHPFGDERMFLSIEPKDFVVLRAPFQKLVNNSFLLHGFYNYRHLILGPDKELGDGKRSQFYLGVPGTYFEREKMVAVMFGFEGFECDGAVETGKFGYYMKRVEL